MAFSTAAVAPWTILSSRAATASGRCRPSGLGMYTPPRWQCPIPSPLDPMMQVLDIAFEVGLIVLPRQPIHPRGGILLQFEERRCEQLDTDVVEERGEPLLRSCPCGLPYAFQLL